MLTFECLEPRNMADAGPVPGLTFTPIILPSGQPALVIQGGGLHQPITPQQVAQIDAWNATEAMMGAPKVLLGFPPEYQPAPSGLLGPWIPK